MSTHPGPADLPGAPGEPVQLKLVLGQHPEISSLLMQWGNALIHGGTLSGADRELIVGGVISSRPSAYVETGHRSIAPAVGLPVAEFELALSGTPEQLRTLSPRQQLLHRAGVELLETADLQPETLAALIDGGDVAEVLEVIYVVHFYLLIACVTRVFRLEPEPDAVKALERG